MLSRYCSAISKYRRCRSASRNSAAGSSAWAGRGKASMKRRSRRGARAKIFTDEEHFRALVRRIVDGMIRRVLPLIAKQGLLHPLERDGRQKTGRSNPVGIDVVAGHGKSPAPNLPDFVAQFISPPCRTDWPGTLRRRRRRPWRDCLGASCRGGSPGAR